jgi:hypothetical protein
MLSAERKKFIRVSWCKLKKKYRARMNYVKGKSTTLGYFDSQTDAAVRYDAAKMATGEFRKLNFPDTPAAVNARANAVAAAAAVGTAVIPLRGAYRVPNSDKWYSKIKVCGVRKIIRLGTFNTQQEAANAFALANSYMYEKEQITKVFCEQFSLVKEKIQQVLNEKERDDTINDNKDDDQVLQHKRKRKTVCSLI